MEAMKTLARRLIGDSLTGRLDYFRHPHLLAHDGPFNGQRFRRRIFFDLMYHFPIKAIVETGTFRGTTTAMFGATGLPVYTSEISDREFAFSKTRFLFHPPNIHMHKQDSRDFLRALSQDPLVPREGVFFYLDAHWGVDLPLREELDIIFSHWKQALVMIDDFQVPGTNYRYDDYGSGKALTPEYIAPIVSSYSLATYYPAVSAEQETGRRRGSVVLCTSSSSTTIDANITTLTRLLSQQP